MKTNAPPKIPVLAISIGTVEGDFTALFSSQGLVNLLFPGEKSRRTQPTLKRDDVPATWIKKTTEAVQKVLAGRKTAELPPMDLSLGTPFQKRVWSAMQQIPLGEASSYGKIATALEMPKAARAVGAACGANPIPLLIPCHRVLAANGALGGYSGGLDWKKRLLALEGVQTRPNKTAKTVFSHP
jgi:O-6-methylguanine DNA methyltransferase